MSISTERFQLKVGGVVGGKRARQKLSQALDLALQLFFMQMMAWVMAHVPRKTGRLETAVTDSLKQSTKTVYKLGVPGVPYASYVDSMQPPINWTKSGSAYNFYQKMFAMVPRVARKAVLDAMRQVGLETIAGRSAVAMAGEVLANVV